MISDMNGENNSQKSLSLPSLTALRCFEVAARTEHFGRAYSIPRPGTPDALAAFLRDENAKWSKAVALSGAQVD